MARIVGKFTDKGREWFAKTLAGIQYVPDALVFLRNEENGLAGNNAIVHTVIAAGFHVSGMSGGSNPESPAPGGSPATGTVLTVPGIYINDGETFTIEDKAGNTSVFEFDKNSVVAPGRVRVPINDTMTAAEVARAIVDAVNAVNSLKIIASFTTRTSGLDFWRMGEGGFRVLPSLQKVPINPADRADKNGIVAGKGVKGDLTIDPDVAPAEDIIIVPSTPGEVPVSDADDALFFVQKNILPSDITLTLLSSGKYRLEINTVLELGEANKTFNTQGGTNPRFYEIGVFAQEGTERFMVGYGTFPEQIKTNLIALINKVVFEI